MGSKIDPVCVEQKDDARLKLEEFGRKVIFLNPANDSYDVTRIDGCVMKSGSRADWMVSCKGVGTAVVELKGKDVGHAIQQIEATLDFLKAGKLAEKPLAAVIMCKQVPKALTSLQSSADRLRRKHGARLKVSSSQFEFSLKDLLPKT